MALRADIEAVIREVFEIGDKPLHDDMRPENVPGWNSFSFLMLILQLEERLGIAIADGKAQMIETIGDIFGATEAT